MSEAEDSGRYWGACPECGENDGFLNIHKEHWFVCHRHKVKWLVGTNLLSSWCYEDEDDWLANEAKLAEYTDIGVDGSSYDPDTIPGLEPLTH